ncbi:MAG: flagellar basal body-associated FliL family protein [Opitutaceae bacterium]
MAAAKSDSSTTPATPVPAAKGEGAASAAAAAPRSGGAKAWLPAIVAVVFAPAATWAAMQYVLLPRFQKQLAATPVGETAPAESGGHGGHGGKEGKEGKDHSGPNYEFQNVVVNLAGTMGTRYLKTSFLVTGADPAIRSVFEGSKPRLTDITLNVLSSLTLADLEEPGAKNVIREKLVGAYNQALGRKVAEQVYFSDFVIQ